jgi:hypothetical protein
MGSVLSQPPIRVSSRPGLSLNCRSRRGRCLCLGGNSCVSRSRTRLTLCLLLSEHVYKERFVICRVNLRPCMGCLTHHDNVPSLQPAERAPSAGYYGGPGQKPTGLGSGQVLVASTPGANLVTQAGAMSTPFLAAPYGGTASPAAPRQVWNPAYNGPDMNSSIRLSWCFEAEVFWGPVVVCRGLQRSATEEKMLRYVGLACCQNSTGQKFSAS